MRSGPRICKNRERASILEIISLVKEASLIYAYGAKIMYYVADLHLHSKYSRAVSPSMTLPVMEKFAGQKGIDILTASDWTHPIWFKEIQNQLEEAGEGVYKLKIENVKSKKNILFLLSTEISSIYKEAGKLRRIHNLVFVPTIEIAEKVSKALIKRGCNLSADGRPIVGLSSRNLLELILSIDQRCLLIPCHVWTPHFGVYGSKSGYDSLEEAFGDLAPFVYGIETGISSDPEMNWRISELANRSILSFSDAHSAPNMAREATVFDLEKPTYENIRQAIMRPMLKNASKETSPVGTKGTKGNKTFVSSGSSVPSETSNRIAYTIEFYPEEGKYHFSGHRNCKVSISPEELPTKGMICPICNKQFTEGVAPRIEQLAGREFAKVYKEKRSNSGIKWYTDKTKNHPPFVKLIRLQQIVAAGLGVTVASKKVDETYSKLCPEIDSEIDILLKTPIAEVEKIAGERIAQTLQKVRSGKVEIDPGYDGLYGKVKIWSEEEETKGTAETNAPQLKLDI